MNNAPEKTINDLTKELAELENLLLRFQLAKEKDNDTRNQLDIHQG